MKRKFKRNSVCKVCNVNASGGFTVLEFLMVFIIIGVFSVIVFVSLSYIRNQGADSTLQSAMKSLANQVSLAAAGGDFTNVLDGANWTSSDLKVKEILNSIDSYSSDHSANVGSNAWAAQVRLVGDTSKYFCVDASGQGSISGTSLGARTTCP